MRILVLNQRDLGNPGFGGAEVHLHEVSRRLAEWGFEVTLATESFRGGAARQCLDGVEARRLGPPVVYYPRAMALCARETRQGRYQAVIECLNRGVYYAPLLSAVPVLALCHHMVGGNAFVQAPAPLGPLVWLAERGLRPAYRRTPFVAISRSTRDDLISRGIPGERIRIVEVGGRAAEVEPEPMSRRGARLVYVGRLVRYKRVEVLLRAAARLAPRFPELRVDIVGRGPDRPRLEREALRAGVTGRTRFHGYLPSLERDRLVAGARATVCPSNREGFGLTVIEANGVGTPAVASDAPGYRDAVSDAETGFLAPVGDVDAFAERIGALLADDRLAERMSRAARAWSARFDWERASRGIEEELRSLGSP